jgi:hypothetical protein
VFAEGVLRHLGVERPNGHGAVVDVNARDDDLVHDHVGVARGLVDDRLDLSVHPGKLPLAGRILRVIGVDRADSRCVRVGVNRSDHRSVDPNVGVAGLGVDFRHDCCLFRRSVGCGCHRSLTSTVVWAPTLLILSIIIHMVFGRGAMGY